MASATLEATDSELLKANFMSNCAFASAAVLVFYEHISTFNREIKFFWGKRSFSAVLFFINRLLALIYGAVLIAMTTNIYSQTRFVPSPLAHRVPKTLYISCHLAVK
ncbi:uncharacterized protein LAESUDRAFT_519115 [Laetiporus sulphureus 93-53]|uniref:DUF6533 domain-containing protein n=1 Tax=Laetiporus sulphureus 93-53 TaxID=1314785 RepID=A0A165G2K7_9APHY|nr:uncharacterized protein LAESUDRAFT_519115 [Laetiporus sulphureus 93-53]KZT09746.1 hypothetical protein LAESUDRAFT_519115 [Laetiporus sulphureus 93-53]